MLRYELGNQFSVETAIVVGELYRYGTEWKFNAVGSGFSGATTWSEADGVVSIKQDGGPETFSIERLVQYFTGHKALDEAFGWGMRWVAGNK